VEVDLRWEHGKAVAVTLRPDFAGEYSLRAPEGQKIAGVSGGGAPVTLRLNADGSVSVLLQPKRSYRLSFA
jgi:hypothetical protein